MGPYYHCKQTQHLIADCPSLEATTSKRLYKKKAMVATWDDSETEPEEEVDTENVCFMTNRDEATNVTIQDSLDDDLSIDELARFFFDELLEIYEILKVQNKS